MKYFNSTMTAFFMIAAGACLTVGCGGTAKPAAEHGAESGAHDEHDHAELGPHGGEIIELGTAGYHAEIVHDGDVIVYILDGSAKAAATIDATEIVINLSHDGKAEQFKLPAKPAATDPAGKSSVFASSEPELVADLKEGHAEVQLVVTVDGKQFRGTLAHDHAHDDEGEEAHAH
jgi:hypothetical protein